jgi:hypothetical protein
MNGGAPAQTAAPLGAFGLHQMPPAGTQPQDLAFGRDLKTLGGRFLCLNAFGTSHSNPILSKRARNIGGRATGGKSYFEQLNNSGQDGRDEREGQGRQDEQDLRDDAKTLRHKQQMHRQDERDLQDEGGRVF